jgi:hypothetical protein
MVSAIVLGPFPDGPALEEYAISLLMAHLVSVWFLFVKDCIFISTEVHVAYTKCDSDGYRQA